MEPLDRISPSSQTTGRARGGQPDTARESFSGKSPAVPRFGSQEIKPSPLLARYTDVEHKSGPKSLNCVVRDKDSLKKTLCTGAPTARHPTSLNVTAGYVQRNPSSRSPGGHLRLDSGLTVKSPENESPKKYFSAGDFRKLAEVDTLQAVQRCGSQQNQPAITSPKGFFIRRINPNKLSAKWDEHSKQDCGKQRHDEEISSANSSTIVNSFCDTPTSVSRSSPKSPALPVHQKSKFGILTPNKSDELQELRFWTPPIFSDREQNSKRYSEEQTADKRHRQVVEPNNKEFRIKSCLKSATPNKADCLEISALRVLRSLSCEQPNKDTNSTQTESNESPQSKPKKQVKFCRSAVVYFLSHKSSDAKSAFVATA